MAEADLARLHGAYRDPEHEAERAEQRAKAAFSRGDRVRLRPRKGGDILDLALAGEAATVVGVEEDFDGRLHYMVTVDADPGADLGLSGQPGHRFFFSEAELERSEP
jgi:hypothetical protein